MADRQGWLAPALGLAAFLSGCAGPDRPRVAEIRHFEEYGGYLPISDTRVVHADWVRPRPQGSGPAEPDVPRTAEEARARIDRSDESIPAPLAPFAVVGVIGVLAAASIAGDLGKTGSGESVAAFCGVPVEIRVVDASGTGIADARVIEIASPCEYEVFVDEAGLRSLSPPRLLAWTPPAPLLVKLAAGVPLRLGRPVELGSGASEFIGAREKLDVHSGDASGRVAFTSLAFARFEGGSSHGLVWQRPPEPLALHHLVWAAGFRPAVAAATAEAPGRGLSLEVRLEPEADGERVRSAWRTVERSLDRLPRFFRVTDGGGRIELEPEGLREIFAGLEAASLDASLPGWLRWNAREDAASLAKTIVHRTGWQASGLFGERGRKLKSSAELARDVLARIEAAGPAGSPWADETPANPWIWREACEAWLRSPAAADHVRSARALLESGRAIEPTMPDLEGLEAAVALEEGDRARAVRLSRFLDHQRYFANLRDGLGFAP